MIYAGEVNGDFDLSKTKIKINPEKYKGRNNPPIKGTDLNNEELKSYIKRVYYVLLIYNHNCRIKLPNFIKVVLIYLLMELYKRK